MKRFVSICLAALLLAVFLALPAYAAREPIWVADSTYYDAEENKFVYYPSGAEDIVIYSTVANGMITTGMVGVRSEQMSALEIYFNGTKLEDPSSGSFSRAGEYVIMYAGGAVPEQVLAFTIVDELTNKVSGYTMPAGFEVTEATLNDEAVAFEKNHVNMSGEGEYNIHYRCAKAKTSYQLLVKTDHTGPTLKLAAVKDGKARGPVDISDAKNAESINIYLDGKKIARTDVLKQSGEYYIELADKAGNKTTYSFTILIYFDGNSWLFILIVLLAAVGTVVYLLYARKHLRVR